ncbi:MAG: glycerol-3-phosphate 1-O-acyltransferase PlsY [Anaerolineales bacterium]|nr:glycerol-3-phosphate 1-O-acyltransferase PlsY [Anaerolineales bacterium]
MEILRYVIMIALGYLMGSIPVGYLVVKLTKGADVRQHGSGRSGGTNVWRAAGLWPAILTVSGDFLKGMCAVLIARAVLGNSVGEVLVGTAAVVGHNWSVFLGWKGGAGTAPNLGVISALSLPVALALIVAALLVVVVSRYASVASLAVAILSPAIFLALALFAQRPLPHALYGLLAGAIVVLALRRNIVRLLAGTERRLSY